MIYELNLKKIFSPTLVKVHADSARKSIRHLTTLIKFGDIGDK